MWGIVTSSDISGGAADLREDQEAQDQSPDHLDEGQRHGSCSLDAFEGHGHGGLTAVSKPTWNKFLTFRARMLL